MIVLNNIFDEKILGAILSDPKSTLKLPKEMYDKFHAYLIQEERYEDVVILETVRDKVVDIDLDKFLNDSEDND